MTFVAVLALLGLGIWVRMRPHAAGRSGPGTTPSERAASEANGAPSPTLPSNPSAAPRLPDRRAADQLRAHLETLFAQAAADAAAKPANSAKPAKAGASAPHAGPALPAADARGANLANEAPGKQIRSSVRNQFIPMAGGCYDELLARHPGVSGLIDLNVAVAGDPSVGGVVEAVKVLPDSTLNDIAFVSCMTESMMSLQFEASAPGQYRFDFDYPFNLTPNEPDEADAGSPKTQ
jgi:hypothetical protein